MERNPHLLFEGCLIGCWAIGAKVAYIYIRGEFYHVQKIMEAELAKAYAQGYVGKNIMGSGFDCDIVIHRGAGAYEAGEETALIESLEGKRAQPRIKPPFPAVSGLYNCADRGQQRRDAVQPAGDPDQRRRVVHGARPREERRAETVLRQRPREEAGRLRSHDEDDAERADLRATPAASAAVKAEGGHPGRIVGPHPPARSARHPGELRRRGQGGVDARIGRHHRDGRDHLHGLGGAATFCTSTSTSRAASARRAAKAATGCSRSSRGSRTAKGRCATSTCS